MATNIHEIFLCHISNKCIKKFYYLERQIATHPAKDTSLRIAYFKNARTQGLNMDHMETNPRNETERQDRQTNKQAAQKAALTYKRVLLKLSGESLAGGNRLGIEAGALDMYAREIRSVVDAGIQTAIVLGGGNIFRGIQGRETGVDRVQGDYMGMLATIINSMALQSALEQAGIAATVLSGIPVEPLCQKMNRRTATRLLEQGEVVIIAGGTGNPFFTTDSSAALRAAEIQADVLLKGTRVDGVYTADPEQDPDAVKFDTISFDEAYEKNLGVMDLTAFTLCLENKIPVIVFNVNETGILYDMLVNGQQHGTLIVP